MDLPRGLSERCLPLSRHPEAPLSGRPHLHGPVPAGGENCVPHASAGEAARAPGNVDVLRRPTARDPVHQEIDCVIPWVAVGPPVHN